MQAYASSLPRKSKRVGMTSEKFGICPSTTRKYLGMSPEEIGSMDHVKAYKKRDRHAGAYDYFNIIYKAVRDGHSREAIHRYVMGKGFTGTYDQLRNAITSIAANNFGRKFERLKRPQTRGSYKAGSIVIRRSDLFREITSKNPKHEPCKIIQDNLRPIEEKYPIVRAVREIFSDFHSAIMGDDPEKLDEFISKYESKKDGDDEYQSPIPSFINGLKRDILPARNAISFPESSGFVEGNNNKFKLIKRILYGRANLGNLFRKCYLCFSFKRADFTLKNSLLMFQEK